MASQGLNASPPSKRRKLTVNDTSTTTTANDDISNRVNQTAVIPRGLDRSISPPPPRRTASKTPKPMAPDVAEQRQAQVLRASPAGKEPPQERPRTIPSPIHLTRIKDLSAAENVDTIGLRDLLGDPLVIECWNFNFLFDIDFVMQHFDPDVKNLVKLKIVHGFWRDDGRRDNLQEAADRYPNVKLISAYMPDPFGTHHSKMMVLFKHDGTAQVIVHTANMISRDWGNMTQAVWRSPHLPLLEAPSPSVPGIHPIGSGERFKTDLLRYLHAYSKRLTDLIEHLTHYDFSSIQAAFLGSTPSRQAVAAAKPSRETSWGWLGLREILSSIPIHIDSKDDTSTKSSPSNIIIQISSMATLGPTPAWITHFQGVLSRHLEPPSHPSPATFFTNRGDGKSPTKPDAPTFNIIFPTAAEIRTSLDGYDSGASIHTKLQSAAQQKQLLYLHPMLCHWKRSSDSTSGSDGAASEAAKKNRSGRGAAAPHIKTYIRFHHVDDETGKKECPATIDWAVVTSANLSKQAWGEVENKKGEVWIQSYECGVVIWPALFASSSGAGNVKMVPVYGGDMPETGTEEGGPGKTRVGFRMPYDLPLEPYREGEVPWCASATHEEPDWKGRVWGGFQPHG